MNVRIRRYIVITQDRNAGRSISNGCDYMMQRGSCQAAKPSVKTPYLTRGMEGRNNSQLLIGHRRCVSYIRSYGTNTLSRETSTLA